MCVGVVCGPGFDTTLTANTVSIGDTSQCTVTAATPTQITCTVNDAAAGEFPVSVVVQSNGAGLATVAPSVGVLHYALTVATVTPARGSVCGGDIVTFTGTGFYPNVSDNQVLGRTAVCTAVSSISM